MLNRIRKALGLKPRISQAHAHQALYLLRRLEDEFAIPAQHGPDRSPIKASLIYDTQALLYATGVGTIGCEHLGLNNDGTPIKRPAPPPKPPLVVHTFRPKPRRTPVPAPPPGWDDEPRRASGRSALIEPDHPWPRHTHLHSAFGPGTLSVSSDDGASWSPVAEVSDVRIRPESIDAGGGGDFSGAGASASWDSSDSGSNSSDSGSSGGSD